MSEEESDLARYYDQEAPVRAARAGDPHRVARREDFIALLSAEQRTTVLEVGTGPGKDAAAFVTAGRRVVGVDLSAAHVQLARVNNVDAVIASVRALPFPSGLCDAGWTMSTLLHVPNAAFDSAMREICRVLRPGAPLAIGLWGAAADREGINDRDTIVPRRFFSYRTDQRVRSMLEPYGEIERFDSWASAFAADLTYQFCVLRLAEEDLHA